MTIHIVNPSETVKRAKERPDVQGLFVGSKSRGSNPKNIEIALNGLGVGLRYNQFAARPEVTGLDGEGPEFTDNSARLLRLLVHETYNFLPTERLFDHVTDNIAWKNRYHPVRDFLDRLAWDGTARIDKWLSAYAGAEDTVQPSRRSNMADCRRSPCAATGRQVRHSSCIRESNPRHE